MQAKTFEQKRKTRHLKNKSVTLASKKKTTENQKEFHHTIAQKYKKAGTRQTTETKDNWSSFVQKTYVRWMATAPCQPWPLRLVLQGKQWRPHQRRSNEVQWQSLEPPWSWSRHDPLSSRGWSLRPPPPDASETGCRSGVYCRIRKSSVKLWK